MTDYFDRVERQLVTKLEAGLPPRSRFPVRLGHLAAAASVLVVVAVGAVFVGTRGSSSTGSPTGGDAVRVVFSASPLDPRAPLDASIGRSVDVLHKRLDSVFRGVQVSRAGNDVAVVVPKARGVSRGRIVALAAPARLEFYDWEASALTPNGKTVASQLKSQDPTAVKVSQGGGSMAPGEPGAGSLPLYEAVGLASKQPPGQSLAGARSVPEYYLFGAPRSPACQTAAREQGTLAVAGIHCRLAGPDSTPQALYSHLPTGLRASQGRRLEVPRGMVVLRAANATAANSTPGSSASGQFYALKDNAVLSGADITNPQQSTDQSGEPDVTFGFSSTGAKAFRSVTAAIAHRGAVIGSIGQVLNQHFAIALDNELLTVPSIDYKSYPDGIPSRLGADITGGLTIRTAQTIATLLRYGPLSVRLSAH
jgi:SecD/SecF fusion protein